VFAGKTFASNMAEFLGARVAFVEKLATPHKIKASIGIALFLFQDIVSRNSSAETMMGGVVAGEYIVPFVLVLVNLSHRFSLFMIIRIKPDGSR
jgi:hypothetical protein